MSNIVLLVVVIAFIVAVIFAANQNDVIGWMVVAIAGGWLILSAVSLIMVSRGARAMQQTARNLGSNIAAATAGGATVVDSSDPMRDTKVDHSLKIVEVQKRVITEELAKGAEHADFDMIERALDTIEMTAHNARDMINPNRSAKSAPDTDNGSNTITGDIIN